MKKEFQRLGLLFGEEKVDLLANKHVAIFGIGTPEPRGSRARPAWRISPSRCPRCRHHAG